MHWLNVTTNPTEICIIFPYIATLKRPGTASLQYWCCHRDRDTSWSLHELLYGTKARRKSWFQCVYCTGRKNRTNRSSFKLFLPITKLLMFLWEICTCIHIYQHMQISHWREAGCVRAVEVEADSRSLQLSKQRPGRMQPSKHESCVHISDLAVQSLAPEAPMANVFETRMIRVHQKESNSCDILVSILKRHWEFQTI